MKAILILKYRTQNWIAKEEQVDATRWFTDVEDDLRTEQIESRREDRIEWCEAVVREVKSKLKCL